LRSIAVAGGVSTIVVLVMLTVGPLPGFVRPWSTSPDPASADGVGTDGPGLAATHSDPTRASPAGGQTAGSSTSDSDGSTSSWSASSDDSASGVPLPPPAVVVEAESASVVRTGSAVVTADPSASGGAYVSGVGNWSDVPGVLVFTGVNLPSTGNWRLTITFLDPGPKGQRHASVVVSGAAPVDVRFAGSPVCCGTRTVDANLTAGTHTVQISNPDDIGPCIDRISFTLLP
jgi:hypothetical protein